ncbi:MAG: DUF4760 domain-containing protein [Proteobacteria bacterium]|nr:DUF4760 domain-containing protein [Pseudomonadota bacterium]
MSFDHLILLSFGNRGLPFGKVMRDKYENPEIFCEFENLAENWQENP